MQAREGRLLPLQVDDCRITGEKGITLENGAEFYQLIYTKSGCGLLHDDKGNEYILNTGDVVFISPDARHDYDRQGGEQWVTVHITFDGQSFSEGLADIIGIPEKIYVFRKSEFDKPEETADMFQRIADEFAEHSNIDGLITHTLLYRLLFILYSALHKYSDNAELSASPIAGALAYIDKHLNEPLNVKEVAVAFDMRDSSFYKAFRKYLDTTPADYIMSKKLKKAKYLLTNTDMPIHDIGLEVGMLTQNYLYRTFHAKVGMTPGEYRRLYPKQPEEKFTEQDLPVYLTEAIETEYKNEISWENACDANDFSILLCDSGSGTLTDELENEHFIRPGYICFLPPDSECVLRPKDKSWTFSRVSFNGKHIKELLDALGLTASTVIRGDGEMTVSHRHCDEITFNFADGIDMLCRYAWDKTPRALLYKSVLLYELIIFTGIAADSVTAPTRAEKRLAPILDTINTHYDKKLTVVGLAESIGACDSTLFRLFRMALKEKPMEYITNVRINRAKRLLLRHADLSVTVIARNTGFRSTNHFIDAFSKKYSVTPDEYRTAYFY